MRYSVWYQGIPIGSVDLPANRLWSGGRAVTTNVVRLIDRDDGKGIRVRAYFREATTGPSAWLPPEEWQPGTGG